MWFSLIQEKKTRNYEKASTAVSNVPFWMSFGTVSSKGVIGYVTDIIRQYSLMHNHPARSKKELKIDTESESHLKNVSVVTW
jgi:hypothetical protein